MFDAITAGMAAAGRDPRSPKLARHGQPVPDLESAVDADRPNPFHQERRSLPATVPLRILKKVYVFKEDSRFFKKEKKGSSRLYQHL